MTGTPTVECDTYDGYKKGHLELWGHFFGVKDRPQYLGHYRNLKYSIIIGLSDTGFCLKNYCHGGGRGFGRNREGRWANYRGGKRVTTNSVLESPSRN